MIGVRGTGVRLADEAGNMMAATVTGLLAEGRLDLGGAGTGLRNVPRREVGLEGLPEAMVEAARWWERHIAEVVRAAAGRAAGNAAEAGVRPGAP